MRHRFGDYELDEASGELRHRGRAVEIQPKPLAPSLFVRERGRRRPASCSTSSGPTQVTLRCR
jgi:hypothetical protein